ncbi:retrovirus-related pol polyprotein from transposon TNT 1-94 [Tanacetum coccineum]
MMVAKLKSCVFALFLPESSPSHVLLRQGEDSRGCFTFRLTEDQQLFGIGVRSRIKGLSSRVLIVEVRVKDLLEQEGFDAALEELPTTTIVTYDNVIRKKDYDTLILCLGDRVLREITKETTAAGIWKKLETLYMTQSLAIRLYLKKKLYNFQMHPGKSQSKHIDEFHKLVGDLAAINTAISDEDQALLLLTSLPSSYDNFVETLLYGRDTLKLENVLATLNSRELQKMMEAKGDGGEGLYVRGRSNQRDMENEDHVSGSGADVMMATSVEELLDWIMDSGGSYHMTYMRYNLFDFEEYDCGNVLLGDGKECRVRGTEGFTVKLHSGKIKVIKGSLKVLSGTRRANCVYTLDSHAVIKKTLKGRKQLGEYQTGWNIKTGNVLDSCSQESTLKCMESGSGLSKVFWAEDTTMSTFLMNRSPSSVIRFKTPVEVELQGLNNRTLEEDQTDHEDGDDEDARVVWGSISGGTIGRLEEFEKLCTESGIARHLTVVGTLQQNRLAERMNITLMDRVRCLLIQFRFPKTIYAEATCTAAYIINMSPSTTIEKKTHMEMWLGHPGDYRMLRVSGCVAYSRVKQGKLEPRVVKCVLLGYPESVKGYRLYRLDNESPKIVTSMNIVFNESVMYNDTLKDSGAGTDKSVEEFQVYCG